MPHSLEFRIERVDVLQARADVVAFKYAQTFHGADSTAARALGLDWALAGTGPVPGEARLVETRGKLGASQALFVGTARLGRLGYPEIREFGKDLLQALAEQAPETQTLMLTVHGPGFGLDEKECLDAVLAGFEDAIEAREYPPDLRRIRIAELDPDRADLFEKRLREIFGAAKPAATEPSRGEAFAFDALPDSARRDLGSAGLPSTQKRSVFVAMPFARELRSLYRFGIYGPAESAGYVCERADYVDFTGDVMQWLQQRIEHASMVIAEVTEPNPNVYLEVGYAWARGKPLVLLAKQGTKLPFDIQGQKCLFYEDIVDLDQRLRSMLGNLA